MRGLLPKEPPACRKFDEDAYGRSLARCAIGERDLGEAMVSAGWALDYTRYSNGFYEAAEKAARDAKAGMHAGTFDPPWHWRSLQEPRKRKRP
jgi:endonuclease YncB( thermonuclease family)